jgi:hypothetical protein
MIRMMMTIKREQGNTWRVLVANSTPMVDLDSKQNSFLVNLERILDLPTPESPISTILNR